MVEVIIPVSSTSVYPLRIGENISDLLTIQKDTPQLTVGDSSPTIPVHKETMNVFLDFMGLPKHHSSYIEVDDLRNLIFSVVGNYREADSIAQFLSTLRICPYEDEPPPEKKQILIVSSKSQLRVAKLLAIGSSSCGLQSNSTTKVRPFLHEDKNPRLVGKENLVKAIIQGLIRESCGIRNFDPNIGILVSGGHTSLLNSFSLAVRLNRKIETSIGSLETRFLWSEPLESSPRTNSDAYVSAVIAATAGITGTLSSARKFWSRLRLDLQVTKSSKMRSKLCNKVKALLEKHLHYRQDIKSIFKSRTKLLKPILGNSNSVENVVVRDRSTFLDPKYKLRLADNKVRLSIMNSSTIVDWQVLNEFGLFEILKGDKLRENIEEVTTSSSAASAAYRWAYMASLLDISTFLEHGELVPLDTLVVALVDTVLDKEQKAEEEQLENKKKKGLSDILLFDAVFSLVHLGDYEIDLDKAWDLKSKSQREKDLAFHLTDINSH